MIDPENESDPYKLAEMELSEKKIPFIVRRYLPDSSYEDWKVSELYIEWSRFVLFSAKLQAAASPPQELKINLLFVYAL